MDKQEFILQVVGLLLGGLGTILLGLIGWGLKTLIKTIWDALVELRLIKEQIKTLIEDTKAIPKMQQDLNALHGKVKKLEGT